MAIIDCTVSDAPLCTGDIVVDIGYRRGAKARLSTGIAAHAGIYIGPNGLKSDEPVKVAHVGKHDFRVEDWNRSGAPKVQLVARFVGEDIDSDLLGERVLERVDEIHEFVLAGEAEVLWAGIGRGFQFRAAPFELLATCIGFVHWCFEKVGLALVDRETIPLSRLHLTECCKDSDFGETPLTRYFVGFALLALRSQDPTQAHLPYRVTAAREPQRESPDIIYTDFVDHSHVRPLPCLDAHL